MDTFDDDTNDAMLQRMGRARRLRAVPPRGPDCLEEAVLLLAGRGEGPEAARLHLGGCEWCQYHLGLLLADTRPLPEARREAVVQAALASLRPAPSLGERLRRWWTTPRLVGVAVLAAVVLFLVRVGGPRGTGVGGDLPPLEVTMEGAQSEWQAEGPAPAHAPIYAPGSRLRLLLRPEGGAPWPTGAQVAVWAVRLGQAPTRLTPAGAAAVEAGPGGVLLTAEVDAALGSAPGPVLIWIIAGRDLAGLPLTDGATVDGEPLWEALTTGAVEGRWQLIVQRVTVGG